MPPIYPLTYLRMAFDQSFCYFFLGHPVDKTWSILGETFIIADDWDHFFNISLHDVIGAGTHAQMEYPAEYELDMGRWYRSKEKLAGDNPYAGYLTNKKWHLNEVFSFKQFVHALILIQS